MEKYLFILIVLVFVGCKNQQRNDRIAFIYNFTIPETLSFELNVSNTLADSILNLYSQDSSKMCPLDRAASIQLLKITNKAYYEVYKHLHNEEEWLHLLNNPSFYDITRFFVYGKLDLQTDVKSIILWKYVKDDLFEAHEKSFWLFNIKDNKVYSVVQLAISWDMTVDQPPSEQTTFLSNKVFTTVDKRTKYSSWRVDPIDAIQGRMGIDEQFTHYCVNGEGFIEFIKDKFHYFSNSFE